MTRKNGASPVDRITSGVRRAIGVLLILLTAVPIWRLLSSLSAPVAREAVRLTDSYASLMLQGTTAVLAVAAVFAVVFSPVALDRSLRPIGKWLCSWGSVRYALVLALTSAALTSLCSWYVWGAKPILVDALAQFVQARYLAAGSLAGPPGLPYEFWVVSNMLVTDNGWVSQYPPGHVAALAFGFVIGMVWLISPLMMAVTVAFTSLAAERLFVEDKLVARTGALLLVVSPFLMILAAAHMSHVTAAAAVAVAAYCALRARDGSWQWAAAAGLAVGAAFATRPLSGLALGAVVTVGIWVVACEGRERPWHYLTQRLMAAAVGSFLPVLAVALYNARFFDSPFRFGYTQYFGANHGLGFHTDPLGNPFGPVQGLAYTSSDLTALGYSLWRTPVSAVLVAGLFLVLARRLSSGVGMVAAWALVLVVPLGLYWHHDLMLGPRMISEAAPAWCLLGAASALGLVRMIPRERMWLGGRFAPRAFVGAALGLALLLGIGFLTPRDVARYARRFSAPVSPVQPDFPTLVFVHDSWNGRIAATLLGKGMRADSVSVALDRNSTCSMHQFATSYPAGTSTPDGSAEPQVVFAYGANDGSRPITLPDGVAVRARPGEELTPECLREAHSDRGGTMPLMPLIWQGDLPGIPGRGTMFVRDLGPEKNASLGRRYPQRRVGVLYRRPADGVPALVPYSVGMKDLWESVSDSTGSG